MSPLRARRSPLAVAALLAFSQAGVALKSTACGASACITVTSADLVNGACPNPATAIQRFSSACNDGQVQAVEGPGTLSDGLCCYPVSMSSTPPLSVCGAGGGEGAGGGFSATATVTAGGGLGGSGGFGGAGGGNGGHAGMSGSGGTGGAGGSSGCSAAATCAAALTGAVLFDQVCGPPAQDLSALRVCGCTGSCASTCSATVCVGNAPDDGCLACLQSGCASQLEACDAN